MAAQTKLSGICSVLAHVRGLYPVCRLNTRAKELMKVATYEASIYDGRAREDMGMPLSVWEGYEYFQDNNMGNLYRQYTSKVHPW